MATINEQEKSIDNALERLGELINEELAKLQNAQDIPDFEKRGKILTVLTKATQNIRDLIAELKSQAKNKNEAIGSVVEFREELARRIQALAGTIENPKVSR